MNLFRSHTPLSSPRHWRWQIAAVVLLVFALLFFHVQRQALAQNATGSGEQTTIDNIKKVIQEKKDELKDLNGSSRRQQAYLAKINRVSEETLALQTLTGSEIVPLNESIKILNFKDNKIIGIDQLAVDDWVAVYGDREGQVFSPKQIVLYDQDFTPKNHQIILGSIEEIYSQSLAVLPRNGSEKQSFVLNRNTKFQDYQGKEAVFADFYEDLQCLIVSSQNDSGNYVVSTIRALVEF